ncbi:MAG: hypothetical protein PVI06_08495 [Desulfobacterales bacterium]|jgi:hypothetical protein
MEKPREIDNEEQFISDLEERVRAYFSDQKKLSTITRRALRFSLLDFPIILANFPFIMGSVLIRSLKLILRNSDKFEKSAQWMTRPQNRNESWTRLLPPYQTFSTKSKLRSFNQFVVRPLKKYHASCFRSYEVQKIEETLMEPLTSWEKIPNLMENIVTVPFWMAGIKFLGLDPKTAIYLSRDVELYKQLSLAGRGLFERLYMKAKWFFGVSIPWSYSLKAIAVGLMAYIFLMTIIEYVSVQFYYREGIEKRLLEKIKPSKQKGSQDRIAS